MKPKTRKIRFASGVNYEHTLSLVRALSETALIAPARVLCAVPLRPFCAPTAPPAWVYQRDQPLRD